MGLDPLLLFITAGRDMLNSVLDGTLCTLHADENF